MFVVVILWCLTVTLMPNDLMKPRMIGEECFFFCSWQLQTTLHHLLLPVLRLPVLISLEVIGFCAELVTSCCQFV